jgi:hypothetical protein
MFYFEKFDPCIVHQGQGGNVFAIIIYNTFWESIIFSGAMIAIPTSTDDR